MNRFVGAACALFLVPHVVMGVTPTGKLELRMTSDGADIKKSWFVSQASFGEYPPMDAAKSPSKTVILPPDDNTHLCNEVSESSSGSTSSSASPTMMLAPRGTCTFEVKALNAQKLGASGILIYGNLANRYAVNDTIEEPTFDDIIWPLDRYDYDCQKGHAMVPLLDFSFDPLPYNAEQNDVLLSGNNDDNLCHYYSDNQLRNCESKLCLLTGNKSDSGDQLEACCAWDLPIWLYNDPTLTDPNSTNYSDIDVTIPAAYLTMEQGNELLQILSVQGDGTISTVEAILTSRYRPQYNVSAVLIWMLGVFVCALAAHMSAADYRWSYRRHQALASAEAASANGGGGRNSSNRSSRNGQRGQRSPTLAAQEESLELSAWHALGFIVMASSGLMILFVFKIYSVVKIMYTIGCSNAMIQVIFRPLIGKAARRLKFKNKIVWRTGTDDFGDITVLDIVSTILAFGVGLSWFYIAVTVRHPDQVVYYWVVQDIMGACMCIVFLGVIKLNSIKVASILLVVAFLYDIFFVFITPLIFNGRSVMITVATSGGPPTGDPSLCEKYPDDSDCQGGDPLPMLLTMPRLFDYLGGASLLGLGDIVLPGLLLSFAARFDAAKALVGLVSGGSGSLTSHSCPERRFCGGCGFCSGGYFGPLVVAYATGLMMANLAVYLMQMGQPALLYLVPCTLGTMAFMGWRRGELKDLWEGPRLLDVADKITYDGQMPNQVGSDGADDAAGDVAADGSNTADAEDPLQNPADILEDTNGSNPDAAPLLPNSAST
eukprot:CAMPEP_0119549340 /NCGR_PEP_ID=MMETSP1352-20130426/3067_1 /TAXON_ID=265584 /ORGANISM="Stauroneis constricta, Strain CCMP1120" /LENGTH=771 /DNA_ID=CAMNT_0007594873 /DNA_START=163 /DNA_END=2478 /DNA_ORIENTATION=-